MAGKIIFHNLLPKRLTGFPVKVYLDGEEVAKANKGDSTFPIRKAGTLSIKWNTSLSRPSISVPDGMETEINCSFNSFWGKFILEIINQKPLSEDVVFEDNPVYNINGVRGRRIKVYENKCVIQTSVTFGSLLAGNASDGEKTIFYVDCVGVQFKPAGVKIGFLQLETSSSSMNNRSDNFFNENSFTFDPSSVSNEKMEEVAKYIRTQIERIKTTPQNTLNVTSAADELKKFKELLDMGIITQEEFNAKKKQLLGL